MTQSTYGTCISTWSSFHCSGSDQSIVCMLWNHLKYWGNGGGGQWNHENHGNWAITNSIDSTLYGTRWKLFLLNKLREIYWKEFLLLPLQYRNATKTTVKQMKHWNETTKWCNFCTCKNLWENRNIHDI